MVVEFFQLGILPPLRAADRFSGAGSWFPCPSPSTSLRAAPPGSSKLEAARSCAAWQSPTPAASVPTCAGFLASGSPLYQRWLLGGGDCHGTGNYVPRDDGKGGWLFRTVLRGDGDGHKSAIATALETTCLA